MQVFVRRILKPSVDLGCWTAVCVGTAESAHGGVEASLDEESAGVL